MEHELIGLQTFKNVLIGGSAEMSDLCVLSDLWGPNRTSQSRGPVFTAFIWKAKNKIRIKIDFVLGTEIKVRI